MPGTLIIQEEIKWTVTTIVLTISLLMVVAGMEAFINREVRSENVEILLEKEFVKSSFLKDGNIDLNALENLEINDNFGLMLEIKGNRYYANKPRYDEGVFCETWDNYYCRNYEELYLVDGQLESVNFRMVMRDVS